MPKEHPAITDIETIYKRQTIHLLIYGFIQGVQWAQPSISKREAATAFIKRFADHVAGIEEKEIMNTYDLINRDILNKNGKV